MGKLTLFFGAGAEIDYGQVSGAEFAESIIQNKYIEQRKSLTGNKASEYQQLINHNSKNIFLQTINNYREEAEKCIAKDDVYKCIQYYSTKNPEYYESVRGLCNGWYKLLQNVDNKTKEHAVRKFFLKNALFLDALDSKFNALRKSEMTDKARKVINTYWIIYILMLTKLYKLDEDFEWSHEAIFDLLNNPDACRAYDVNVERNTYYRIIRERYQRKLSQNSTVENLYQIITTNYTDILEQELGFKGGSKKCDQIIHLHGSLNLFEDLERLVIYDCTKKEDREEAFSRKEHIFPYILIPSGVKPIICKKQICDFYEFNKKLEVTSILIVVGYQFNLEDNHINSMIGEWIRGNAGKPKRMIYLNYENKMDWEKHKWFSEFLQRNYILDFMDRQKSENRDEVRKKIKAVLQDPDSAGQIISISVRGKYKGQDKFGSSVDIFDIILECCDEMFSGLNQCH